MSPDRFDPRKFIDRTFEQEIFEELLRLKDQARILAIRDAGGMGKTHLLHRFQYRCRTANQPRIPVSLVALDQLPDDSPLALAQQIAKELSGFSLEFPTFTAYETARNAYDFSTIRGAVDLRGADLRQAQVTSAGVMAKIEQAGTVTVTGTTATFTPEQQAMAHEICVRAFLEDLAAHSHQQLVVIMLDAYEKCDPNLQDWLLHHFLGPYCFDAARRPAQLVTVIAGREIPDFELYWSPGDCDTTVKSVRALSKWTADHVEECLRVYGFSYNEQQLKLFCDMIEMSLPPSQVVEAMRTILPLRPR